MLPWGGPASLCEWWSSCPPSGRTPELTMVFKAQWENTLFLSKLTTLQCFWLVFRQRKKSLRAIHIQNNPPQRPHRKSGQRCGPAAINISEKPWRSGEADKTFVTLLLAEYTKHTLVLNHVILCVLPQQTTWYPLSKPAVISKKSYCSKKTTNKDFTYILATTSTTSTP